MRFSEVKTMAINLGMVEQEYGVLGGGTPYKGCNEYCCFNRSGNKDEDTDVLVHYCENNVLFLEIGGLQVIQF